MNLSIRPGMVALLFAAIAVFMMSLSTVAEAKRLGGGKSFGQSKQVAPKSFSSKQDTAKPAQQPNAAPAAAPAGAAAAGQTAAKSGASKWLGPLAGLAAGGLLAAMIFGDGFEGFQAMDFILFALIGLLLFMLFKKRRSAQQAQQPEHAYSMPNQAQPEPQPYSQPEAPQPMQRQAQEPAPAHTPYDPNAGGSLIGSGLSGEAPSADAQPIAQMPEWFDANGFIEGSKQHFVTLQKAWDDVDLSALASYCTPELLAALEQELQGVKAGENQTSVEELNAELADQVVDGDHLIVSVRFSGFIDEGEGAHAFTEIWHIRRLAAGEGNWEVSGIQQTDNG